MAAGVLVEERAGLPRAGFDRLAAELASLGAMSRAPAWCAAQAPPLVPGGMVTQDEFSFDLIVPYRDGLYLGFDST